MNRVCTRLGVLIPMRIPIREIVMLVLASAATSAALASDQEDRRGRTIPGLVVDTGSRMGACDVLTFTSDGKNLLAAGDDKAVRVWPITDEGIDAKRVRTLRWSIWHEQRGNIYALALDQAERKVAIAGKGVLRGMVLVLNFATGEVLNALTDPKDNDDVIRALAFSPSGNQLAIGADDGSVWLWGLTGGENYATRLGPRPEKRATNRIRLLRFDGESSLQSVAQDGRVLQWDLRHANAAPLERFRFFAGDEGSPDLYRVVATQDGTWLAAAAGVRPEIEVRSLQEPASTKRITLSRRGEVPMRVARSLAFDRSGQRLAVGIRTKGLNDYFHGANDEIRIYDLARTPPLPTGGPRCSYHAEGLAFHPDGKRLAIAGGDDHDVAMWDLTSGALVGEAVRGPGRCLWSVGLSADDRYLGFRDQRADQPKVNERGVGPWRVFDLKVGRWQSGGAAFQPILPVETAGRWKISFLPTDVFQWSLEGPDGRKYRLAFSENAGGAPLCYTFIQASGKPIRLAVGQYYGAVSVFELGEQAPRGLANGTDVHPVRIFMAHQGEVMAIAPSANQEWLVTASRDQTVTALSLEDWAAGNELGASFTAHDSKVFVERVDAGSPAWEAGLNPADEILLLAYDGQPTPIYNRTEKHGGTTGTPEDCLRRLRDGLPGKEFYFLLKRPEHSKPVQTLSRAYRRPKWRFFPTKDREWVLWLWRSSYYDTSTHGDYLIGWHVNQGDRLEQRPDYYPAEKMRAVYHRPDLVYPLLWTTKIDAEIRSLAKVRPPRAHIDVAANRGPEGDLTVTVSARSLDTDSPDQRLTNAELWIEDYRFMEWRASGREFAQTVKIPAAALRSGANQVTFQCTNVAGGSEEATARIAGVEREEQPSLYGLVVGIKNYEKAKGPEGTPKNLRYTVEDARAIRAAWLRQSGRRYRNAEVTPLLDEGATRQAVLKHLADLKPRVRPDDLFVLYLGGHGVQQPRTGERSGADRFVFCCPDFDISRPEQTGISSDVLIAELAKLPCRKLILLDVCHAGLMAANPVRGLTPGGKGPTILASCDKTEAAMEDDALEHGLFTFALVEALVRDFDAADRDHDQKLDADELFSYAEDRVPLLLQKLKRPHTQNPTRFPNKPDRYPLAIK